MTQKTHIMIVDSDRAPSHLGFLLKLAGFEISEFGDELEACNWLLQQDIDPVPAEMLLLNNPQGGRTLYALLFQIRQLYPRLELLFVQQDPLELTGQIRFVDPPVRQCTTSEVHSLTRQILGRDNKLSRPQQPHGQTIKTIPSSSEARLSKAELEE